MRLWRYILILCLCTFTGCSIQRTVYQTNDQLPPASQTGSENFQNTTGRFLFYVSSEAGSGDIWLYNLDQNAKYQITFLYSDNIILKSCSPDYKYLIYNDILYSLIDQKEQEFSSPFYREIKLQKIKAVNWADSRMFYCVASTNGNTTGIFKVKFQDQRWFVETISFPLTAGIGIPSGFSALSLAPNKSLLAFIARDEINQYYIYIYDLDQQRLIKLVRCLKPCDLLWSEKCDKVVYYENTDIFSIHLNGIKELLVTGFNPVRKLFYNLKYQYKFFYITYNGDTSTIYLRDMDTIGQGDMIVDIQGLRDIAVYENPDILYYDINREIFYYDLNLKEQRAITGSAALFSLNE